MPNGPVAHMVAGSMTISSTSDTRCLRFLGVMSVIRRLPCLLSLDIVPFCCHSSVPLQLYDPVCDCHARAPG